MSLLANFIASYERIPGPSKRHRHIITGEEISYRSYMQQRQEAGYQPTKPYKPMTAYRKQVEDFRRVHGPDVKVKGEQASLFREVRAGLKSTDTQPGGAKARALILLGRRDPEAQYDVGQTPKASRKRG